MELKATNKTALYSGLIAGLILGQFETWGLNDQANLLIMFVSFVGTCSLFAIGHNNIHIKAVFAWADLTEGEKQAFSVRIPVWFVSLAASAFVTHNVMQFLKGT